MQKLGQHFLKNDSVIKKIIAALELCEGDTITEIGPGHGELTLPLASACAATGATLAVIEKDAKLAEALKEKLAGVAIAQGDALTILPKMIADTKQIPFAKKYKLVGNLPYYITGKLLRIISELGAEQKPERCIFMVQLEVAERIVAVPPSMNRLAASVQFWANTEIVAHVGRGEFSPPPKVDSAVIALKEKAITEGKGQPEKEKIDPALYYRAMHGLFAQPRKTVLNNFAALSNEKASANHRKDELATQLRNIGIDPEARPQNLDIQQIIAVAKIIKWG